MGRMTRSQWAVERAIDIFSRGGNTPRLAYDFPNLLLFDSPAANLRAIVKHDEYIGNLNFNSVYVETCVAPKGTPMEWNMWELPEVDPVGVMLRYPTPCLYVVVSSAAKARRSMLPECWACWTTDVRNFLMAHYTDLKPHISASECKKTMARYGYIVPIKYLQAECPVYFKPENSILWYKLSATENGRPYKCRAFPPIGR